MASLCKLCYNITCEFHRFLHCMSMNPMYINFFCHTLLLIHHDIHLLCGLLFFIFWDEKLVAVLMAFLAMMEFFQRSISKLQLLCHWHIFVTERADLPPRYYCCWLLPQKFLFACRIVLWWVGSSMKNVMANLYLWQTLQWYCHP